MGESRRVVDVEIELAKTKEIVDAHTKALTDLSREVVVMSNFISRLEVVDDDKPRIIV